MRWRWVEWPRSRCRRHRTARPGLPLGGHPDDGVPVGGPELMALASRFWNTRPGVWGRGDGGERPDFDVDAGFLRGWTKIVAHRRHQLLTVDLLGYRSGAGWGILEESCRRR